MSHVLQSKEWIAFQESRGFKIVRVGNSFMQIKKMPYFFKDIGFMYRAEVNDDELDSLKKIGQENNLSHIHVEPEEGFELKFGEECEPIYLPHSVEIGFEQDIDEILQNMDKNTRYNALYGRKKGVTFEIGQSIDFFNIFIDLVFKTINRKKYFGRNRAYYESLWEKMSTNNKAIIAIAKYEGKPLIARMLFLHENKVYTPYTGTSIEHRNLKAANTIILDIIEWGKANSYKSINLWGIDYEGKNKSHEGFSKFKMGFGGRVVEYPKSKHLVINRVSYILFQVSNMARLWIRELRRLLTR